MPIDAISLLVLFGLTIAIGYAGGAIFNRTKIPDVLLLLLFGLLIGPIFGLVDKGLFVAVAPLLAPIALLIILFDAGLNIEFYNLIRNVPRSMLLTCLVFFLSTLAVAFFTFLFFGFTPLEGFIIGAILGGTSAEIIIPLFRKLKVSEKAKNLLSLESVLNDPVVIITTISLIGLAVPMTASVSPIKELAAAFSVGAMAGLVSGIVWLFALDRLKGKQFTQMLTLAIAFLLYAFVEIAGGNGALAVFTFGLVLGNGIAFSKMLKFKKIFTIDEGMRFFEGEISFFIRSFFFVMLGLIAVINFESLIIAIAISIILIVFRVIGADISLIRLSITKMERNMIRVMGPRGLATAVMAQLPAVYGLPRAEVYSSVAFIVIFATVIFSTISAAVFYRGREEKTPPSKKPRNQLPIKGQEEFKSK